MRKRSPRSGRDDRRKRLLVPSLPADLGLQPGGNGDLAFSSQPARAGRQRPARNRKRPPDERHFSGSLTARNPSTAPRSGTSSDSGHGGRQIAMGCNRHPVGLEAEAGNPRVPHRRGDRLDGAAGVLEAPGAAHLAAALRPVAEVGEEHNVARRNQQRPGRPAEAAQPAHVGQVRDQDGGEPTAPEGRAQARDAPRIGTGGAHEARSEATALRASR